LTDRFRGDAIELSRPQARDFALLTAANELDLIGRGVWDDQSRRTVVDFLRRLAPYAPEVLTELT
jgi:hypothetical protein